MSLEYCHACDRTIDTDTELDHWPLHLHLCRLAGLCAGEIEAAGGDPCGCQED